MQDTVITLVKEKKSCSKVLKHKPAPREVLHGSPLWQWRRRPRSLCQRCCAQASSRLHSAWLSRQGARTYDSLQSKEWITPTRSKLLNWKKHDPDCLTDRPPRCQINSTKPKDQISLQGWKIRIQIAYVRVWGAPFRTAWREGRRRGEGASIPGGWSSPAKGRRKTRRRSPSRRRQEGRPRERRDGERRERGMSLLDCLRARGVNRRERPAGQPCFSSFLPSFLISFVQYSCIATFNINFTHDHWCFPPSLRV